MKTVLKSSSAILILMAFAAACTPKSETNVQQNTTPVDTTTQAAPRIDTIATLSDSIGAK